MHNSAVAGGGAAAVHDHHFQVSIVMIAKQVAAAQTLYTVAVSKLKLHSTVGKTNC